VKSRAIPEAQGEIKEIEGKRVQVRYREAPFTGVKQNWERWPSYGYTDTRTYPSPQRAAMPAIAGDPAIGRKLFMDRDKGPCTGCHLIQGEDVWPAGNVGPDLSVIGDRNLSDQHLFDLIYDARLFFPRTSMPPWGAVGIFTPEEIVHLVAFLKTQKGHPPFKLPREKDPLRNPFTRPPVESYFGDNLDPMTNPAVLQAEDALPLWNRQGPKAKSCADCHGAIEQSMKGVATRYPRFLAQYARVMSIEDLLAAHAGETTGTPMPSESESNLHMSMLVKMQSNGLAVNVDIAGPEAKAAHERGRAGFYKRVGARHHACADCHTPEKGGGKWLGGRLLARVEDGLTRHFPTYRTNFGIVWDIRKRMQWCMLPLGMNYLAADAPEYAEIELYLTSFDNGKPMSVPGIRH
jgi:sulfur-oxidizing protein SoxA